MAEQRRVPGKDLGKEAVQRAARCKKMLSRIIESVISFKTSRDKNARILVLVGDLLVVKQAAAAAEKSHDVYFRYQISDNDRRRRRAASPGDIFINFESDLYTAQHNFLISHSSFSLLVFFPHYVRTKTVSHGTGPRRRLQTRQHCHRHPQIERGPKVWYVL